MSVRSAARRVRRDTARIARRDAADGAELAQRCSRHVRLGWQEDSNSVTATGFEQRVTAGPPSGDLELRSPRPLRVTVASLLPVFALLVFAFGPGSFAAGRDATAQALGWVVWIALAWRGRGSVLDPLALRRTTGAGDRGGARVAAAALGWLPAALISLSALGSPAAADWRLAGGAIVATLAVAGARRCAFEAAPSPRLLARGLVAVMALVAAFSLVEATARGGAPAQPLGHHNLLVLFLLALAPVAAMAASRTEAEPAAWRFGAAASLLLALAAVLASRSLTGAVGVVLVVAGAVAWGLRGATPTRRAVTVGTALLVAVSALLLVPALRTRAASVLAGEDRSSAVRQVYAWAALAAIADAPLRGWGPGRGGFALSERLAVAPGVVEPGLLVSDAHSLWLEAPLELGVPGAVAVGLVLLLAARASWRRREAAPATAAAASLRDAAAVSLVLSALLGLAAGWFDVGALWLLLVVLLGAALGPFADQQPAGCRLHSLVVAALLVLSLAAAVPDLLARAVQRLDLAGRASLGQLERAASWGAFGDRLAFGLADPSPAASASLEAAAEESRLWPVWLLAGDALARRGDDAEARQAWREACDLAPLAPFAALRLAALDDEGAAVEATARALIAEPRIAGASLPPGRLDAAVARLEHEPGLPLGWRAALVVAHRAAASRSAFADPAASPRSLLRLTIDGEGETSLSLFFSRRAPRPLQLPIAEVDAAVAADFDLVPAARLAETDPGLWQPGCRLRPQGAGPP